MEHLFVFLQIRYFGEYTDAQQQLNKEPGHSHWSLMLFGLVWMESHGIFYYFYYESIA